MFTAATRLRKPRLYAYRLHAFLGPGRIPGPPRAALVGMPASMAIGASDRALGHFGGDDGQGAQGADHAGHVGYFVPLVIEVQDTQIRFTTIHAGMGEEVGGQPVLQAREAVTPVGPASLPYSGLHLVHDVQ